MTETEEPRRSSLSPHSILHELSKWPYDQEDKYSLEYLLSKMPQKVSDLHLKMLKSEEGYEFWYSNGLFADKVRGEAKEASDALCRLAIWGMTFTAIKSDGNVIMASYLS